MAFQKMASPVISISSIILTALSYQFLSEAISIRPEAFIYLLYSLIIYISLQNKIGVLLRALAIGVLGGLLISSKFSLIFIWIQSFLIMCLVHYEVKADFKKLIRYMPSAFWLFCCSVLGCIAGIAIGAPEALADPAGTFDGIRALMQQYSGAHYPFGRPDGNASVRILHSFNQTQSHIGFITIVLSAFSLFFAIKKQSWAIAFIAASSFLFLIYFSIKPVFFARNFSFLIPIIAFLALYTASNLIELLKIKRDRIFFISFVAIMCVQPGISALDFSRAALSFESRRDEFVAQREFYEVLIGLNAEAVDGWDEYHNPVEFIGRVMREDRALIEFRSLNDRYSMEIVNLIGRSTGMEIIGHSFASLSHFPMSMVHFNFDINNVMMLRDEFSASDPVQIVPKSEWCAEPLSASVSGTFSSEGFHSSVLAEFEAFGSWLGGDEATARSVIHLSSVPDGAILPVFTGPGRQGITLSVGDSPEIRIFTASHWLGVSLPATNEGLDIVISDNGTGWGEWAAFGLPRLRCR
ncbi:hypothetical protein L2D00_01730 [Hyphomonadaceae bacterium BL14]|nr:hypothetical protein L2D00_01730 [Hyphomonadaceae bacterium BL14]